MLSILSPGIRSRSGYNDVFGMTELSRCYFKIIATNGPAVCFSRRNPTTAPGRVLVPRASGATKLSRCKEGLARVFAVMVQILLSSGAVAVQV